MIKRSFVLFCLLSIAVLFQNCKDFGDSGFQGSRTALLSGGEAYDGKLHPGKYVHEVVKHGCIDLSEHQRSKAEIESNNPVISITESSSLNCNGNTQQVLLEDLTTFSNLPGFFVHRGKIFKHKDLVKKEWVSEILCTVPNSKIANFHFEFSPNSKKTVGSSEQYNLHGSPFLRSLTGEKLTYSNDGHSVKIDLSTEVFRGIGKYSAIHQDLKKGNKSELHCYNGAGTLPRFKFKTLKTFEMIQSPFSLGSSIISRHFKVGLSPNKEIFYSMTMSEGQIFIQTIDSVNGAIAEKSLATDEFDEIHNVFWQEKGESRSLLVVLADSSSVTQISDNFEHKLQATRIFKIQLQDKALSLGSTTDTSILKRNTRLSIFKHRHHLYWMTRADGDSLTVIRRDMYSSQEVNIPLDYVNLGQPIAELAGDDHKYHIDKRVSFRPEFSQMIMKLSIKSPGAVGYRSRLLYLNFENKKLKPLTDWAYIDWQKRLRWIDSETLFYDLLVPPEKSLLFGSIIDGLYKVRRVKFSANDFGDTEIAYSEKNYERFHIEKVGDELILLVEPEYAYLGLPSRVLKLNSTSLSEKRRINFGTSRALTYHYSTYDDSVFLLWNKAGTLNNYFSVGNFDSSQTESNNLSYGRYMTDAPTFFTVDPLKSTFLMTNSSNHEARIFRYGYRDQTHHFDVDRQGFDYMYRVKNTNRVIMAKLNESNYDFILYDINRQEETAITDLIPATKDDRVQYVEVLKNRSKFVVEVKNAKSKKTRLLLINLDNM